MGPVVDWLGGILLEPGQAAKKLNKSQWVKARDALEAMHAYDRAVQACRMALQLAENDPHLLQSLKDLEAERTMQKGGYGAAATGGEGSFTAAVKDIDEQRVLDQEDRISQTESAVDEMVRRRRGEFDENPQDNARLARLVEALVQKSTDESENEAMTLLTKAWEDSGQYALKMRRGDIYMRQLNRHLRALRPKLEADPHDAEARKQYVEISRVKIQFELEEFTERVKNYPTDMGKRFELGKRLFLVKKFDEAIAAFQEAQADAKFRVPSLQFLGMCYLEKGWFDEAIGTLRNGIKTHPLTDDRLALDLRYLLMDALARSSEKSHNPDQAREAQEIASGIIQIDINFRDIRDRRAKLKDLADKLSQPK